LKYRSRYPRAWAVRTYLPGVSFANEKRPSSPVMTVVKSLRLVTGAMATRARAIGWLVRESTRIPPISKSPDGGAGAAACCAAALPITATDSKKRLVIFKNTASISGMDQIHDDAALVVR